MKCSEFNWDDNFEVDGARDAPAVGGVGGGDGDGGGKLVSAENVIKALLPHMTEERQARMEKVVASRTLQVVSVLENIYDRGNVSAVMRSSEAFGLLRMYLVDAKDARFKAANRVTRGAEKWLDVKSHSAPEEAVAELKAQNYQIWSADLQAERTIETLDWSRPMAIVLGNEKDGVSAKMSALVDGRFRIAMDGFSQSFNISVAAALIFYHAHRELKKQGASALLTPAQQRQTLANYCWRCFDNPSAIIARYS